MFYFIYNILSDLKYNNIISIKINIIDLNIVLNTLIFVTKKKNIKNDNYKVQSLLKFLNYLRVFHGSINFKYL